VKVPYHERQGGDEHGVAGARDDIVVTSLSLVAGDTVRAAREL
jgi:hypothetical protein